MSYCATCNNLGTVECECGGDFCACGQNELPCPDCGGDCGLDDYEQEADETKERSEA